MIYRGPNSYEISDEEYSKGMPYITEYIQWLKEFQKK